MTLKGHKNHYDVKFLKGYGFSVNAKDKIVGMTSNILIYTAWNLFFFVRNYLCTKTGAFAKESVKSIRLENQEMEPVAICQVRYDVRSVEFLSQGKDAMTEKIILQLMTL